MILQQCLQTSTFRFQLSQLIGVYEPDQFDDGRLTANIPLTVLQVSSFLQQMSDNRANDIRLNRAVQPRAVSYWLNARTRLESGAPGVQRIHTIRFGFAVNEALNSLTVFVESSRTVDIATTLQPHQTDALCAGYFQTIQLRIEATHVGNLPDVIDEVVVLAVAGVASLEFGAAELVRTTGQDEKPGRRRTARGYDGDPWGQFVRMVANDPVDVRIEVVIGWHNGFDLKETLFRKIVHILIDE